MRRAVSEIIGLFLLLMIIILVVIPLLFYVTFSYSNSLAPPSQPSYGSGLLNVTYYTNNGVQYVQVSYTPGTPSPAVLAIYNYSNGVWVKASYTAVTTSGDPEVYKIEGPANTLLVELAYVNKIFYVQVGLNSSVLVG